METVSACIQGSSSSQAEVKLPTPTSSMRTKTEHLNEIDRAHQNVLVLIDELTRTRRNVPTGSYIHTRLIRSVDALSQVRRDLEFTFHSLEQNGYSEMRWSS
jgi:hypothetical protein